MSLFRLDPLYEFELWDTSGVPIGDITQYMRSRHYTLELNAAETLTFSLDLKQFENYCANWLNVDPNVVLAVGRTDIKVKREGQYVFGSQVTQISLSGGSGSETIAVTCSGYLDFFKTRYITKNYSQVDSCMIARDILATVQTGAYNGMGVSIDDNPYQSGVLRDQTYQRSNVKDELINLAESQYGPFDFAFSANRAFQTYQKLGIRRNDLNFTYGVGGNIDQHQMDRLISSVSNRVYGLGSGFGSDQLVSVQEDTTSEQQYYVREDIEQFNSVTQQTTLDQNTQSVLLQSNQPLAIPILTIRPDAFTDAWPGLGDRVFVDMSQHSMYRDVVGVYRIIKIDVTIDENDAESVMLYFDDLGVNQNEPATQ